MFSAQYSPSCLSLSYPNLFISSFDRNHDYQTVCHQVYLWKLVVLSLIGLFNRIVDPFWYYREIEIKGFNAVKLEFRFVQKILLPQDKLIMETSRIFYGDDTEFQADLQKLQHICSDPTSKCWVYQALPICPENITAWKLKIFS